MEAHQIVSPPQMPISLRTPTAEAAVFAETVARADGEMQQPLMPWEIPIYPRAPTAETSVLAETIARAEGEVQQPWISRLVLAPPQAPRVLPAPQKAIHKSKPRDKVKSATVGREVALVPAVSGSQMKSPNKVKWPSACLPQLPMSKKAKGKAAPIGPEPTTSEAISPLLAEPGTEPEPSEQFRLPLPPPEAAAFQPLPRQPPAPPTKMTIGLAFSETSIGSTIRPDKATRFLTAKSAAVCCAGLEAREAATPTLTLPLSGPPPGPPPPSPPSASHVPLPDVGAPPPNLPQAQSLLAPDVSLPAKVPPGNSAAYAEPTTVGEPTSLSTGAPSEVDVALHSEAGLLNAEPRSPRSETAQERQAEPALVDLLRHLPTNALPQGAAAPEALAAGAPSKRGLVRYLLGEEERLPEAASDGAEPTAASPTAGQQSSSGSAGPPVSCLPPSPPILARPSERRSPPQSQPPQNRAPARPERQPRPTVLEPPNKKVSPSPSEIRSAARSAVKVDGPRPFRRAAGSAIAVGAPGTYP